MAWRTRAAVAARWLATQSTGGRPVGAHITRYTMYQRLGSLAGQLGLEDGPSTRVVAISRSEPLCHIVGLGKTTITSADFPDYDLRALPFADGEFDALVADQVLEHVEADPAAAVAESFRVVRRGGIVIHTTCFINPLHEATDLWRFSPSGLDLLFEGYGEMIECGGWGNRFVWLVDAVGLRLQPVPHHPRHPLNRLAVRNDPLWPVSTWAVARKHEA